MHYKTTESLLAFIKKSPTAFQATAEMEKKFAENGYQLLSEQEYWKLQPGGKYIVIRNRSALIAFSIPKKECRKFHIIASHSDSPAFKIKENPEIRVDNAYTKLNVEGYGGMLMAPWFDRPLSVAGRVVVRRDGSLKEELVNIRPGSGHDPKSGNPHEPGGKQRRVLQSAERSAAASRVRRFEAGAFKNCCGRDKSKGRGYSCT